MLRKGKTTEVTVAYEPYMWCFGEWIKQLHGESEGKDNKGLFPASMIFSTDLHSLGQYVQQGLRNLFETVIWIKRPKHEIEIPDDPQNTDGLNFITGKSMQYVNEKAFLGTTLAHINGGVPNINLELDDSGEYSLGYLMYFYEMACAVSGYLLGVNPFNQPGVEAYKVNMFALLGKPGYEEKQAELQKLLT
jgi:glucose-6-phosphate isomerase